MREATRDYKEAQDKLVSDVTNHADEDTLKIDRAQLEAAAQAMAQAMAALAQETADAQRARDDARSARQPGPASLVSTATAVWTSSPDTAACGAAVPPQRARLLEPA